MTVFEEIQKNQDLVKQIQKGDVKDLDSLTKEMVNNTKAIQQIIEKQAAATAAQISS